jgi:hypothetical protein
MIVENTKLDKEVTNNSKPKNEAAAMVAIVMMVQPAATETICDAGSSKHYAHPFTITMMGRTWLGAMVLAHLGMEMNFHIHAFQQLKRCTQSCALCSKGAKVANWPRMFAA